MHSCRRGRDGVRRQRVHHSCNSPGWLLQDARLVHQGRCLVGQAGAACLRPSVLECVCPTPPWAVVFVWFRVCVSVLARGSLHSTTRTRQRPAGPLTAAGMGLCWGRALAALCWRYVWPARTISSFPAAQLPQPHHACAIHSIACPSTHSFLPAKSRLWVCALHVVSVPRELCAVCRVSAVCCACACAHWVMAHAVLSPWPRSTSTLDSAVRPFWPRSEGTACPAMRTT
jgi:hypothetical protein